MTQIRGTNLSAPVVPFTDHDEFPTHYALYGKGGYRTVQNIEERDLIPSERREEGMLVWVIEDPSLKHLYQYLNQEWIVPSFNTDSAPDIIRVAEVSDLESVEGNFAYVESKETIYVKKSNGEWTPLSSGGGGEPVIVPAGGGIPIYTREMYDALEEKPQDWISIPSETELDTEYGGGGYYVDILFNAIRSLQSEVARLKNSFKYGINSYTGKDTAMSRVSGENDTEPEEPLWATTEEDLSEIVELNTSLENDNTFLPKENVEVLSNGLRISETAEWNGLDGFMVTEDSKLYIYLTTSGQTIRVNFKNLDDEEAEELTLDLEQLDIPRSDRYNILIILSRKVDLNGQWASDNFVWVSISNWATGVVTNEGYWNPDTNKLTIKKSTLESRYVFDTLYFTDQDIYKLSCYSKYQDFSGSVIPTTPSDEDYKYKVAHITIRSVSNYTELKGIEDQLPKNELIYNEESGILYIKTATKVKAISGGGGSEPGDDTSGMEKQEIIEWLAKNGIIVTDEGGDLRISQIADITFVHQGTGKKFKFEADAEGKLHSTELSNDYYEGTGGILSVNSFSPDTEEWGIRGFVGTLGDKKLAAMNKAIAVDKDHGLYSDRVKIGSIYAPAASLTSHGCSHAFIELENTSDQDFLLDGCYLHYATGISGETPEITAYHLALEGIIPAGGTYLIRGKQYTDPAQANCFIDVNTFDKEWYIGNGELIDLTPNQSNTYLLTYGMPDLSWSTIMWRLNLDNATKAKAPFVYNPHFIDAVSIGKMVYNGKDTTNSTWNPYKAKDASINASIPYTAQAYDCIYKNTFELEPAKQGYQSLGTIDSSRLRGVTAGDFQYLKLDKDVIEFPKSDETFPVARYTPKASWEHKNVCTDKSKLDMDKPNMVTCSFGINIHTTRCFNWISAGEFNEYVWLRPAGASGWINRFESYKAGGNESDLAVDMTRVEYTDHPELRAAVYERLHGTFPADGTHYTAHKCIVKVRTTAPSQPTEYEYIVGRADKNMNPDPAHSSKIQKFTVYPNTYTPRIFQTTDQQGFHWVEYQAWAAAAEEVNKLIDSTVATENIIPILVNTGDMTQNGTRVNEWLDYYNGGACLFDHLEQMNVVGNNDLVGTNPEILGTGDDNGKSNGHYFHVFYCYEVDPEINPIIPSTDGTQWKYVPSFYYFENESSSSVDSYRFVFLDTEITTINCRDWFKRVKNDVPINVYTGWPITDSVSAEYDGDFKTIYTMIYEVLDGARTKGQHIIAACHEMPFTVVTNANLASGKKAADRSMNGTSLVGCHCNRLGSVNERSIYWLSRLLEYFQVKLMIGGHKHTYACTNPLREFYFYDGGTKNSLVDGPMEMENTLENDNLVTWKATLGKTVTGALEVYQLGEEAEIEEEFDTTKFPIMEVDTNTDLGVSVNSGTLWPYYGVREDSYPKVTYLMCQATGFKLKSNKELPSSQQKFSYVIPKTDNSGSADSPNDNQLKPMFTEIVLNENNYTVYLRRIEEITNGTKLFSQQAFSTKPAKFMYLKGNETDGENEAMFGHWVNEKTPLIEL